MSIHSEHPFSADAANRDPVRQLRGRMPAPVTIWACGSGRARAGLTVSSMLVAEGEPSRVLGLIDEESSLWDGLARLPEPRPVMINLLGPKHEFLAETFAGTAPAPGGPFTLGNWVDSPWGPKVIDAVGWIGVRLDPGMPRHCGYGLLVEAEIESVELAEGEVLSHVRGRYRGTPGDSPG